MARGAIQPQDERRISVRKLPPNWTFTLDRVTGRDPALGYPIAIFIGPDIEPEAIPAGTKLQVAGPLAGH